MAQRWFAEEYEPVMAMLREAGLIRERHQETEAYLRLAADRYRLLRTHAWDTSEIEVLRHQR